MSYAQVTRQITKQQPFSPAQGNRIAAPVVKQKPTVPPPPVKVSLASVVDNRFHIRHQIGNGGYGQVFLALDVDAGVDVALKVISGSSAFFTAEAQALAQIAQRNSPFLCGASGFGYCASNEVSYISMEYVEGFTLSEILNTGARFDLASSVRVALDICRGLQAAPIVHGDVGPKNVMLAAKDDTVKIIDFGVGANFERARASRNVFLTGAYAAPERWEGKLTSASDIFSLGVTFYEMFTGQHPTNAKSPVTFCLSLMFGDRPKDVPLDIYMQVSSLLQRMTSLNPAYRPKYAEIIATLEQVQTRLS